MRRLAHIVSTVVVILGAVALVTSTLVACNQTQVPVEGFTSIVSQIAKNPRDYDGQAITIVGYFRGQDLLDEVQPGFPPTDRLRDWVIKDNSGAIYVQASEQLPFSTASQDIWRVVSVTGTVFVRDVGSSGIQPHIIPERIEWQGAKLNYDALPAYCTIAIHRFEGTEQLNHHTYIYDNRNVIVNDAKTSWRGVNKLRQVDYDRLQNLFKGARFFDLPDTVGQACQGCVRYYVAAVNEDAGIPHYVTLYEGSVPDKLGQFFDQALELAGQAEPLN